MTNIALCGGLDTAHDLIGSGATSFCYLGTASSNFVTTENNVKTTWRTAGTFSNMYCNMLSAAATDTLTYRKGGVNGNQTITIAAAGEFTDNINTDSVSAGDLVNYQFVNGQTGNATCTACSIQFSPTTTTNTVNRLTCNGALTDTTALTAYYNTIVGNLVLNTTEANAQFKNKTSATLQNLYVFVSANTASIATVTSRVATAAGNLTISITSGATGVFEDTTNNDSISSGGLINTAVNATVATTFSITNISVEYLTTNNKSHYLIGDGTGTNVAAAFTEFCPFAGKVQRNTTESNWQIKTLVAFTASNLESFISANNATTTFTINFRKNGANGNQAVTYLTTVTGYAEDTTHTDSIGSSDEINYRTNFSTSGTTITVNSIGILGDYSPIVPVVGNSIWFGAIA